MMHLQVIYGLIQFVVDVDGSVSDIKALTNHWLWSRTGSHKSIEKGNEMGTSYTKRPPVKAYRKQPITFQV